MEGEGLYTVTQQPTNWGVPKIHAPSAWLNTHGSEEIVVAVIDSGIDFDIPQLASCMWVNKGEIPDNGIDDDRNGFVDDIHGWDFRDNDNSSLIGSRLHWHGAFVASIIAAWPGDNAIVGVAPGVKIMDVLFLDSKNLFYGRDWKRFASAIDYAVDNGARIINLSIYTNGKPPAILEEAIRRALRRDVIIVAITGNDGEARVTSLIPGGIAATKSGTSFAAPSVSAVLALILSVNPGMTAAQAATVLERSVTDLGGKGWDKQFGFGA